jgi:hypothetical protein
MSRTVTCAPYDASAVSGSVFAGNGGASALPSPDALVPAADDDGVREPDALPDPTSEEPHPVTRTAASRRADSGAARLTTPSVSADQRGP